MTGVLRGVVTDQSGAAIPGAVVTATASSGPQQSAIAGDDGGYIFRGLQPGSYSVQATAPGFALAAPATISIDAGTSALNLQMHIAVAHQEVTVTDTTAPEVSIDPTQSASAQVMRSSDLESLANDADDLLTDLQALAGPSAGLNGGQIFIDGFTAGDGTLPSKDAIREVRINQNPFLAGVRHARHRPHRDSHQARNGSSARRSVFHLWQTAFQFAQSVRRSKRLRSI